MPPKVRITKEDIVRTAVCLVRENGGDVINARVIADRLGCSTQPIFSNFESMKALRCAVIVEAEKLYSERIASAEGDGKMPPYKAKGMAYIDFARTERELFKLLFMRDRAGEVIPKTNDEIEEMSALVSEQTGLDADSARLFHIEMWVFVHGIASMTATGYLELDRDIVSRMLTDMYNGMKLKAEEKK